MPIVSQKLSVCEERVRTHLHAIRKVQKLSIVGLHELTADNELQRLTICSSYLTLQHNFEPFLDQILTCDEKWITYNNNKRSYQWLSSSDIPKHTPHSSLYTHKEMLCIWWTAAGI